jgi:hypothetical protein
VHKLWRIALILKGIIEKGIAHADLGHLRSLVDVIFELLIPHPIIGILTGHDALILCQLINNIDIVKDVENECLDF